MFSGLFFHLFTFLHQKQQNTKITILPPTSANILSQCLFFPQVEGKVCESMTSAFRLFLFSAGPGDAVAHPRCEQGLLPCTLGSSGTPAQPSAPCKHPTVRALTTFPSTTGGTEPTFCIWQLHSKNNLCLFLVCFLPADRFLMPGFRASLLQGQEKECVMLY